MDTKEAFGILKNRGSENDQQDEALELLVRKAMAYDVLARHVEIHEPTGLIRFATKLSPEEVKFVLDRRFWRK